MQIEFNREDFETLLLALGSAAARYFMMGDRKLAYRVIKLTNLVNKDNPIFTPYEIPEEFR